MEIVEEIDSKLLGSSNQGLKGIPSFNSLSGTRLQAHIAFADALPGPQVQQDCCAKEFQDEKAP